MSLGQGQEMTLPFNTDVLLLLQYVVRIYQLSANRLQLFLKNLFTLFLIEKPSYQNWPCCKIGQGQPRVIIYSNFVKLESQMLHAKFQDHRTSGSVVWKCLKAFTIYGCSSHLGNVTWTIYTNFGFPVPKTLNMKIGIDWPCRFREGILWKWWVPKDGRTLDRWTSARYTISSPCEPNGSGQLRWAKMWTDGDGQQRMDRPQMLEHGFIINSPSSLVVVPCSYNYWFANYKQIITAHVQSKMFESRFLYMLCIYLFLNSWRNNAPCMCSGLYQW